MSCSITESRRRRRPSGALLAALLAAAAVMPLADAAADDRVRDPALGALSAPSIVVPLDPTRILDTRAGVGVAAGRLAADQTITLQVTGVAGIPPDATGVLINLTVTEASGAGYVTAYPTGATRPNASVIDYSPGEDVANMIVATLGTGGAIDVFNAQAGAHLIADVAGYLIAGGGGTVGPQGPAGPQGPQGPQGLPAPTGVTFSSTLSPATPPTRLAVASIASTNVFAECGPGFDRDAAVVFLQSTAGSSRIIGSKTAQKPFIRLGLPNSDVDTYLASAGGGAGSGVSVGARVAADGSTNRTHVTGVLRTASGAFLQVDLAFTLTTTACTVDGVLTPAA